MFAAFLKKHVSRIQHYDSITGMSHIVRRYFVMNSFDGALTTFGLLLGSYAADVQDGFLIIRIGIGTAIAIGFSGLVGALFTERAERKTELRSMERFLHRSLDNSDYKKAYDYASLIAALVDGFSPLLTSIALLSPFLFLPVGTSYFLSFALALTLFFALGGYLGRISKENIFAAGIKFVLAGIVCMLVILSIEAALKVS